MFLKWLNLERPVEDRTQEIGSNLWDDYDFSAYITSASHIKRYFTILEIDQRGHKRIKMFINHKLVVITDHISLIFSYIKIRIVFD